MDFLIFQLLISVISNIYIKKHFFYFEKYVYWFSKWNKFVAQFQRAIKMNDFSEKGADRRFEVPDSLLGYVPVQAWQRQVQTSFRRIKIVLAEELLLIQKRNKKDDSGIPGLIHFKELSIYYKIGNSSERHRHVIACL